MTSITSINHKYVYSVVQGGIYEMTLNRIQLPIDIISQGLIRSPER